MKMPYFGKREELFRWLDHYAAERKEELNRQQLGQSLGLPKAYLLETAADGTEAQSRVMSFLDGPAEETENPYRENDPVKPAICVKEYKSHITVRRQIWVLYGSHKDPAGKTSWCLRGAKFYRNRGQKSPMEYLSQSFCFEDLHEQE